MNPNTHTTSGDIVAVLFQPKMLLALVFVWILVVASGSTIAIWTTQRALMTDAEVEALLSENERLAQTANVAYAQTSQVDSSGYDTTPVFPDRLIIPSLGTDLPVSNPQTRNIQTLDEELKQAVVRYPDAATLGEQGGNVLVFGHSSHLPIVRNQLYKAFNDIETLKIGDTIQAVSGRDVYTYHVTRVYEASANDDSIPLDVIGHRITLLTCDTFGKKSDRFVVEAEFIGKNI